MADRTWRGDRVEGRKDMNEINTTTRINCVFQSPCYNIHIIFTHGNINILPFSVHTQALLRYLNDLRRHHTIQTVHSVRSRLLILLHLLLLYRIQRSSFVLEIKRSENNKKLWIWHIRRSRCSQWEENLAGSFLDTICLFLSLMGIRWNIIYQTRQDVAVAIRDTAFFACGCCLSFFHL